MANCAHSSKLEGKDLEEWKRLLSLFLKQLHVPVYEFANYMGVSKQTVYYWLHSSKVDWTVFLSTLVVFDTLLCKAGGYKVCPELCDEITLFYRNILSERMNADAVSNQGPEGIR